MRRIRFAFSYCNLVYHHNTSDNQNLLLKWRRCSTRAFYERSSEAAADYLTIGICLLLLMRHAVEEENTLMIAHHKEVRL